MKNGILALSVCVFGTLPMFACKQDTPTYSKDAPTYSEENLAQNQAYAIQSAKMASENALKTATPPKLESSNGTAASFPLPVPTKSTPAP